MTEALTGSGTGDQDRLGIFMAEVVERLRRGEPPTLREIEERFPGREEEIQAALGALRLLEAEGMKRREELSRPKAPNLGDFLNRLPPLVQRVIYLRDFKKLPWKEISGLLSQGERDLRMAYARAIREILAGEGTSPSGPGTPGPPR